MLAAVFGIAAFAASAKEVQNSMLAEGYSKRWAKKREMDSLVEERIIQERKESGEFYLENRVTQGDIGLWKNMSLDEKKEIFNEDRLENTFNLAADKYDVDPIFLKTICNIESSFDISVEHFLLRPVKEFPSEYNNAKLDLDRCVDRIDFLNKDKIPKLWCSLKEYDGDRSWETNPEYGKLVRNVNNEVRDSFNEIEDLKEQKFTLETELSSYKPKTIFVQDRNVRTAWGLMGVTNAAAKDAGVDPELMKYHPGVNIFAGAAYLNWLGQVIENKNYLKKVHNRGFSDIKNENELMIVMYNSGFNVPNRGIFPLETKRYLTKFRRDIAEYSIPKIEKNQVMAV